MLPPGQKSDFPAIVGVGGVKKEVLILELPTQPLAFVTVTEKLDAVLTVIVLVVAPVDQE